MASDKEQNLDVYSSRTLISNPATLFQGGLAPPHRSTHSFPYVTPKTPITCINFWHRICFLIDSLYNLATKCLLWTKGKYFLKSLNAWAATNTHDLPSRVLLTWHAGWNVCSSHFLFSSQPKGHYLIMETLGQAVHASEPGKTDVQDFTPEVLAIRLALRG